MWMEDRLNTAMWAGQRKGEKEENQKGEKREIRKGGREMKMHS